MGLVDMVHEVMESSGMLDNFGMDEAGEVVTDVVKRITSLGAVANLSLEEVVLECCE